MEEDDRYSFDCYGWALGYTFGRNTLYAGVVPTRCIFGIMWSDRNFEVCLGPFMLGINRAPY